MLRVLFFAWTLEWSPENDDGSVVTEGMAFKYIEPKMMKPHYYSFAYDIFLAGTSAEAAKNLMPRVGRRDH